MGDGGCVILLLSTCLLWICFKARAVVRDGASKKDSFSLPSCAATPYYRPVITSVAQQKRAAGPVVLPKVSRQHTSMSCEVRF